MWFLDPATLTFNSVSWVFLRVSDLERHTMIATSSSSGAIALAFISIALYLAYRAILPKPIPGIPYNKDAAGKILGDIPEMMGHVMRTKRVFVR